MANMDDLEMTADEFDARAAVGEEVMLDVHLRRPQRVDSFYRLTVETRTGISAPREFTQVGHAVASQEPTRA